MMNSRMSFKSIATLSALALLWPFAANAQLQAPPNAQSTPETAPSAQASATSNANSLTCKLGSAAVIINNGPATLLAGTKIVVRFYPSPGAGASMTQKILRLKSDLPPGVNTSIADGSYSYYQDCTARVAAW